MNYEKNNYILLCMAMTLAMAACGAHTKEEPPLIGNDSVSDSPHCKDFEAQ